jgi:hypothetical protein
LIDNYHYFAGKKGKVIDVLAKYSARGFSLGNVTLDALNMVEQRIYEIFELQQVIGDDDLPLLTDSEDDE